MIFLFLPLLLKTKAFFIDQNEERTQNKCEMYCSLTATDSEIKAIGAETWNHTENKQDI